jgi:hypothetical protein
MKWVMALIPPDLALLNVAVTQASYINTASEYTKRLQPFDSSRATEAEALVSAAALLVGAGPRHRKNAGVA